MIRRGFRVAAAVEVVRRDAVSTSALAPAIITAAIPDSRAPLSLLPHIPSKT